jgi:hypothetical protein
MRQIKLSADAVAQRGLEWDDDIGCDAVVPALDLDRRAIRLQ